MNQRVSTSSPGWIQILHLFSNTKPDHSPLACHSAILPSVLLSSAIATRHCEFDNYIVVAITGCWWWGWSSDLTLLFIIEFGRPISNDREPIKYLIPPGSGPPSRALPLGRASVAQCLPAPLILQNATLLGPFMRVGITVLTHFIWGSINGNSSEADGMWIVS